MRDVFEVPAFELGAVGKVEIFGESVGRPATGVLDGCATPDPGGAVEVEEKVVCGPGDLFDGEVAVDAYRLGAGEEGGFAVEVCPASLNEAGFLVGEMGDEVAEEIFNNAVNLFGL